MEPYLYTPETFRQPRPLHALVLWGGVVASAPEGPVIIRNKDGHLQVTCWYRGRDLPMLDPASREVYFAQLQSVLLRLGTGWCLFSDEWHVPARPYPETRWSHPPGYFLDALREKAYQEACLHEPWCFLTLVWRPPSLTQYRLFDAWFAARKRQDRLDEARHQVQTFHTLVRQMVEGWGASLDTMRFLTRHETATYLHWCTSGDRQHVQMPARDWYLAPQLATGTLLTGRQPRLDQSYFRCLGMPSWPEGDLGCHVPLLLHHLPFPYRLGVRLHCLDKTDGDVALQKYERQWDSVIYGVHQRAADGFRTGWGQPSKLAPPDPSLRRNEEAVQHRDSITQLRLDGQRVGYLTPVWMTWGPTPDLARRREDAAWEVLQAEGFVMKSEEDNAVQAFFGMIPGDVYHNVRKPALPMEFFWYLASHSVPWEGIWENTHLGGPPLLIGTRGGAPFPVVTHVQDLGHVKVIGPTGSGKTAKLGLMGTLFLKYKGDPFVLAFDRKYGLYVVTHLNGGHYYTLGSSQEAGIQPLRTCGSSLAEMQWCQTWLHDVFQAQLGGLTVQDKAETWKGLERLARLPEGDRTLSNAGRFIQDPRLKEALQAFQVGGRYAFFDANQDSFALEAPWTTFAMDAILELPEAIPHFLKVIFHRAEQTFQAGRPAVIIVDEAKDLLDHPLFGPQIVYWLTQKRSANVSVWFATQHLQYLQKTAAWPAILGSGHTWIFTADDTALSADVRPSYEACDLTGGDLTEIAHMPRYARYFLKTEGGKGSYDCFLPKAQRLLCGASDLRDVAAFQRLLASQPTEPLPIAWLRDQGCVAEADWGLANVRWPHTVDTPALLEVAG